MKKDKQLLMWLAIGAVLLFVANKKSNTEPVAADPLLIPVTPTGDPTAEYIQPQNIPVQEQTYSRPVFVSNEQEKVSTYPISGLYQ